MIYTSRASIQKNFNPGDRVYACAFTLSSKKAHNLYFAEPVEGQLCCGKSQKNEPDYRANDFPIKYFVPYSDSGKLCWSKAVDIDARLIATTEAEAHAMFNYNVAKVVDWFHERAEETSRMSVTELVPEKPKPFRAPNGETGYMTDDYAVFLTYVWPFMNTRPCEDWTTKDASLRYRTNYIVENVRMVKSEPATNNRPATGYALFNTPHGTFWVSYHILREFPDFIVWDF